MGWLARQPRPFPAGLTTFDHESAEAVVGLVGAAAPPHATDGLAWAQLARHESRPDF